jgi:predicted PurR-regulated permease PerM
MTQHTREVRSILSRAGLTVLSGAALVWMDFHRFSVPFFFIMMFVIATNMLLLRMQRRSSAVVLISRPRSMTLDTHIR